MQALAKMMMGFTMVFMPGVFAAMLLAPVKAPVLEVIPQIESLAATSGEVQPPAPIALQHESWQLCHREEAELLLLISLTGPGMLESRTLRVPLRGGPSGLEPWQGSVSEDNSVDDSNWSEWIAFSADITVRLSGASVKCEVEALWSHDRYYEAWEGRCLDGEVEEQVGFTLSELLEPRTVRFRDGVTMTCRLQPAHAGSRPQPRKAASHQ